jgi:uncharacterized membrane protein YdjX (TVP38/TMEM64 family)
MTDSAATAASSKWRKLLWLVAVAVVIGLAIYFKIPAALQHGLKDALNWIASLGTWGPIIFIAVYVLACVLFVPGSVLTLGAGALFGVVKGSIYTSIGATLGATCAFLVGRYLARDWITKRIGTNPKFKAIDDAVATEGWKIVGLIRLAPIFPFTLINYAFGLTRVSLRDYVLASWIAMMPGTVMYVYFGSVLGDLAKLDKGVQSPPVLKWIIGILTVLVTIYITRFARKALAQKISRKENPLPQP